MNGAGTVSVTSPRRNFVNSAAKIRTVNNISAVARLIRAAFPGIQFLISSTSGCPDDASDADPGVLQLWAEVSPNLPSFNFEHGHGLGVLAVGPQQPPAFLDFLRTANTKPGATRALFAALGRRVLLETEKHWLNQKSPVQRALTVLKSKSLLR